MGWQLEVTWIGRGSEGSISAEASISGVVWASLWEFVEVVGVENGSL
jgi:hypothetical protein